MGTQKIYDRLTSVGIFLYFAYLSKRHLGTLRLLLAGLCVLRRCVGVKVRAQVLPQGVLQLRRLYTEASAPPSGNRQYYVHYHI